MNLPSMTTIMAIIGSTIPFVLMTLRSSRINLKKPYRGHQFIMPFVAIVYCVMLMFSVNALALKLIKWFNLLTGLVSFIPFAGKFLESPITSFLNSTFNIGYGIQLLCNTLIMVAFCILKRVVLVIANKFWSAWKGLYRISAGIFYEEIQGKSILKTEFAHVREYLNLMYYTMVGLGAAACVLSLIFSNSTAFQFPFYPVFGIIVLGEICFFLDGETLTEARKEGHGPKEKEGTSIFDGLLEKEQNTFNDRVLLADTVSETKAKKSNHSWINELSHSDHLDDIAGAYFESLSRGVDVQPDYVLATCRLLHKQSVLIHNPFYRDITDYALLPVFHELLNNKRILVVCGRAMNERDVVDWLTEGVQNVTNLPKLWRIGTLENDTNGGNLLDIGVLGFRRLYDVENMTLNKDFFAGVSFIIILEPSNLLGTGQMGLRTIVQMCEGENRHITYLALDRNVDGLVDALSHVIRQPITEVIAAPVPEGKYHRMMWRAEGPGMQNRILPKISHYLGIGGEIGALAMSEQVQNIHWYSGSKMPLMDLRWNIGQYYSAICDYIGSPREQYELDSKFNFHESLWQAQRNEKSFTIVEDEFCNLFDISRTFASRENEEGFINVISESYMLRDYMCDNDKLFTNDPKAIPSIVPDYAQTERNFVIRMLLLMAIGQVGEKVLSDELTLQGYETRLPYEKFVSLVKKYVDTDEIGIRKIQKNERTRGQVVLNSAYIADRSFVDMVFDSALKSAYYIVENEKLDLYMMGNRLLGQVEQVLLPGQFFAYEGRNYQVRRISRESGIVVRRAGDHLTGRQYYRQLRNYTLSHAFYEGNPVDLRGMNIRFMKADMDVVTDGYYIMTARNALKTASLVKLENNSQRHIKRKDILTLEIPGAPAGVVATLCILFNELFQTIYPNDAAYIMAGVSGVEYPSSSEVEADKVRTLLPTFTMEEQKPVIYFIEDSAIDLGVLVSIERNLQRFLEIIADYLDWYLDPKRERLEKKKKKPEVDGEPASETDDDGANVDDDGMDIGGEDEAEFDGMLDTGKDPGMKLYEYFTFGYDKEPDFLKLKECLDFLKERKFLDNNLHRARGGYGEEIEYDPNQPGVHYCDFCGAVLKPGEYDVLKDGRERCPQCAATAVKKVKDFKQVYKTTLKEMETIFGIDMRMPIKVRMVNAKKVNDGMTSVTYEPSPGFDSRVLGYAQRRGSKYMILVENGAPLWKMKSTLAHELTHIWQYTNWGTGTDTPFGAQSKENSEIVEGMAVWVEVQYLTALGRKEDALRYRRNREADPSEYGTGMVRYLKKYPIVDKKSIPIGKTPFGKNPPLK